MIMILYFVQRDHTKETNNKNPDNAVYESLPTDNDKSMVNIEDINDSIEKQ